MKKYKKLLPLAGICMLIAVVLAVRFGISYLTDSDSKENVITIGNVSLSIDEGDDYVDNSVIAAGQSLSKAPSLINDGTNDEYVFMTVAVPKKNVTLLYEEDTEIDNVTYSEGTPIVSNRTQTGYTKNVDQIYRMIADGVDGGAQPAGITGNNPPQVAFTYNCGDSTQSHEGWVYLSAKPNQTIESVQYDIYYFGYNKRLNAVKVGDKEQTIPLFDHVQLKSFIDEELVTTDNDTKTDNGTKVIVKGFGIQADSLELDLPEGDTLLTTAQLTNVYNIVVRKQVMP